MDLGSRVNEFRFLVCQAEFDVLQKSKTYIVLLKLSDGCRAIVAAAVGAIANRNMIILNSVLPRIEWFWIIKGSDDQKRETDAIKNLLLHSINMVKLTKCLIQISLRPYGT